jgi:hypothetical protein
MDNLSSTKIIAFTLIFLGGLLGVIYWGNLAWRYPDKFKATSFPNFLSSDKGFVFYLWFIRILVVVAGLVIIFSLVVLILNFVGVTK